MISARETHAFSMLSKYCHVQTQLRTAVFMATAAGPWAGDKNLPTKIAQIFQILGIRKLYPKIGHVGNVLPDFSRNFGNCMY